MWKPAADSQSKRALLLAPEAPYPLVGGGPARTASLLEYLARRYQTDLILFREDGAGDPAAAVPDGLVRSKYVITLPRHSRGKIARLTRNLWRLLRRRAPLNDRFGSFREPIRRALDGQRYDLAVVEHFWCAAYLPELAAAAKTVILDLHNIESALLESYAQVEPGLRALLWRRFARISLAEERRLLPSFSLVLAACEKDAQTVRSLAPEARVAVYPNTIPHRPAPPVPEQDVIVFSGNLEYPPNRHAVRYFASRIWPALRRERPELIWRIVGRNPEAVRPFLRGDPRVELTGPVEDALPWIAAAKVVVVPVQCGSGTRVKILEAWAAGRAVISTSFGAEGLPARSGEHLWVADGEEAFLQAVLTLLNSEPLRRRLGESGRRLYEREFTWDAAWRRLADLAI
ncbi:MAG: glycosyltransferase family 4 protein [Bryobacterales bacterium]|nr:glycosyltransferase family 4 protein [Bryobacteraceae bacterium]MDW8355359.1 glycosyltransferase family 4 protein [Bryobacterales bacterium]